MSIKNGMSLDKNQQLNIVNSLLHVKNQGYAQAKRKFILKLVKQKLTICFSYV